MNKKWLMAFGAAAVVIVVMISGWVWRSRPVAPNPIRTVTAQPVSCGVPASDTVSPVANIHIPDNERIITKIDAGQTVRWINDSSETVTMRSAAVANDKECGGIGQPTLKPGETWQLTFLRSGTWHFAVGGVGIGVVNVK